jgi:hypothetical protein
MQAILLSLLFCVRQSGSGHVGPEDFGRIAKGALADIGDVSFVYEGFRERADTRDPAEHLERKRRKYQGTYAWRSDGSILLDYYTRAGSDDFGHITFALFGGTTVKISRAPDKKIPPATSRRRQSPWALAESGAHKINFLWYYHWLKEPSSLNYVDLGWETIDGHRCLKVQLDLSPGPADPKKSKYRLWVDLERGAWPLRIEHLIHPPAIASRTHSIELQSYLTPSGKSVWLPVAGVHDSFLRGRETVDYPIWHEVCKVAGGSVVLDKRLPDKFFSISSKDSPRGPTDLVLRREFESAVVKAPPRLRTDPESVEKRLKTQLEEAERQASLLEAPSPARARWLPGILIQAAFFCAGVAMISWAIVQLRRSR